MSLQSCKVLLKFQEREYLMVIPEIKCTQIHSFSPIIAISEFLSKNIDENPPIKLKTDISLFEMFRIDSYEPKIQLWNEYIKEIITNNLALSFQDKFAIIIPISSTQMQEIRQKPIFFEEFRLSQDIKDRQILMEIVQHNKQFSYKRKALVICQDVSTEHLHKPTVNIGAIMLGSIFNNEQWVIYDLPKMKNPPSFSDFMLLDAVFISGSQSSANNLQLLYKSTFDNLRDAYFASDKLKIMGICFGHQIIAQIFGGLIGQNRSNCSITGIGKVSLHSEVIRNYQFLHPLMEIDALYMTQAHGQQIHKVPEGFQIWSSSTQTQIQGLVSKNKRILTTQFHSQVSYEFFNAKNLQLHNCRLKQFDFNFGSSQQVRRMNSQTSRIFLKIIRHFLQ